LIPPTAPIGKKRPSGQTPGGRFRIRCDLDDQRRSSARLLAGITIRRPACIASVRAEPAAAVPAACLPVPQRDLRSSATVLAIR
jgi:hypothetical protein